MREYEMGPQLGSIFCLEWYNGDKKVIQMEKFRVQSINRHRLYIDGKGINTLVGLMGCPLLCKYCLNKKALSVSKYREMSPREMVEEVLIDYCYFKATGGGITFGGGESLLQSSQIKTFREVLPKDIPIKVETSLNVARERLLEVIDVVDEYIIDVKTMNPKIYRNYTGVDNKLVVENLDFLCERNLQHKCKIRIPNIPDFTTKEDVEETETIIKSKGFTYLEIFDYVIREEEIGE